MFLALFFSLTPISLTASTVWKLNRGQTSSSISLHYNYHSFSFFTSSSTLLLSFIHLSLAHTFTNPIRDSLAHKPRSCDILELLNTLFSFPSLKCSLNSGFFLSSLLKYGSNYSYYVLKPLRRPFFPPQS